MEHCIMEMARLYGYSNLDIVSYCWHYGYWTYEDIVDDAGNTMETEKVITRHDFQNACDSLGIEFDCINY